MGQVQRGELYRRLHALFDAGAVAGLTDGELLEKFVTRGGETAELAFSALVERHGPAVLRVCHHVLRNQHDAEDAFQATFLVLANRARSIRRHASVGSWLHGVAFRIAADARFVAARRRAHERQLAGTRWELAREVDDVGPVIHEEIRQLPERLRTPVELCYLQGQTCEEAAGQLGWPVGTVKSRLARARARLRLRLARRGVAPTIDLAGAIFSTSASRSLVETTVQAAIRWAACRSSLGIASSSVASLTNGALWAMALSRWTSFKAVTVAATLGLLALSLLLVQLPNAGARTPSANAAPSEPHAAADVDEGGTPNTIEIQVAGRALDHRGRPVKGASVFLISQQTPRALLAKTMTDHQGRYTFAVASVPVSRWEGPHPATAPFVAFQVFGLAPGLGVAWNRSERAYAIPGVRASRQNPEEIRNHLRFEYHPFGAAINADLAFRPAEELQGRVVDEHGDGVSEVKIEVHEANPLSRGGKETGVTLDGRWVDFMPDGLGAAETDREGRFHLGGLPSETCFRLQLRRLGAGTSARSVYVATTKDPDVVAGTNHHAPAGERFRPHHGVADGQVSLIYRIPRHVTLQAIYDDTAKPISHLRLSLRGEYLARDVTADGETDAEGMIRLLLPPGHYRTYCWEPPPGTPYVTTFARPFAVSSTPDEQQVQFRLRRGSLVNLVAADAGSGNGIPDVFFWIATAEYPRKWQFLSSSTNSGYHSAQTDRDGKLQVILDRSTDTKYVIKVGGIRGKNVEQPRDWTAPARIGGQYEPVTVESEAIRLSVQTPVVLKFELRK